MSHQGAPSYPAWSSFKKSVNAKGLLPLENDFERVQGVVDREEKKKKLIDTLLSPQVWQQPGVGGRDK